MDIQEALAVADAAMFACTGKYLSDRKRLILSSSWEGLTYEQMSEKHLWSVKTLKDEGADLWKRLSEALGEKVTKKNFKAALERRCLIDKAKPTQKEKSSQPQKFRNYQDWQEAPDISIFFGREEELKLLEQWILKDRCQLVGVVGFGGIGKTKLSVRFSKEGIGKTDVSLKFARTIKHEFTYIIWCSLLNAPPLTTILTDWIHLLSDRQETRLPDTIDDQLTLLLQYLLSSRCLFILDNMETILQSGDTCGKDSVLGEKGFL